MFSSLFEALAPIEKDVTPVKKGDEVHFLTALAEFVAPIEDGSVRVPSAVRVGLESKSHSTPAPSAAATSTPTATHSFHSPTPTFARTRRTTPGPQDAQRILLTPTPQRRRNTCRAPPNTPTTCMQDKEELLRKVGLACEDTLLDERFTSEARTRLLRWCNTKPEKFEASKLGPKLRSLLLSNITEHNPHLLRSRADGRTSHAVRGLTPLLAAASAGNVEAARILLLEKFSHSQVSQSEQLAAVDLNGQTALHLAADGGHADMIAFLVSLQTDTTTTTTTPSPSNQQRQQHSPSLHPLDVLDLAGMTPLGVAGTSLAKKARVNKQQLEGQLFSPENPSIFGSPSYRKSQRCVWENRNNNNDNGNTNLRLSYGSSHMPGKRVRNEDVLCATRINEEFLMLGVMDGHSDDSRVAAYVATRIPQLLQQGGRLDNPQNHDFEPFWEDECTRVCLAVDAELHDQRQQYRGGSTAVFCLVSERFIVVANVGDSRCILIAPSTATEPALVDEQRDESASSVTMDDGTDAAVDTVSGPTVVVVEALSHDHKPDLSTERERIEQAGLQVVEECFTATTTTITANGDKQEEEEEFVIAKVELNEDERMATARAFGDFEYKEYQHYETEDGASAEDEAIVAAKNATMTAVVAVPDVILRERGNGDDDNDDTEIDNDQVQYMVLACDGIWDVMSSDRVGEFVVNYIATNKDVNMAQVGDALIQHCYKLGSTDNLSAIVVKLNDDSSESATTSIDLPAKKELFSR